MKKESKVHRCERPWAALMGLVVACVCWGLGFPLTKAFVLRAQLALPGVGSWCIASGLMVARFTAAALLLLIVERRKPTSLEWEQGLLIGIVTGAGTAFQTDGMAYTSASTCAFLTQGYVIVLPLVAAVTARQWPEVRVAVPVLVNLLGLAVLAELSPLTLRLGRGEAETLIGAMLFSLQILLVARRKYAKNRPGPITLIFFAAIALGTLPFAINSARTGEVVALARVPALWALLGALALFATLTPFWLMNRYQPYVLAAEAGVIYGLEPLCASVFALFLPELLTPIGSGAYANEQLTGRLLLGGSLVTLANVLLQIRVTSAPTDHSLA